MKINNLKPVIQNNFPQKTTARVLINRQDSVSFIGNKKLFKKIPYRLESKYSGTFHITSKQCLIRNYLELKDKAQTKNILKNIQVI